MVARIFAPHETWTVGLKMLRWLETRGEDKDKAEQIYCTKSPIIAQRQHYMGPLNILHPDKN